ncbi:hypothetical protein FOZ63_022582 [Perkinsus olseni]|uniref:Uncharacterized protein n=1 Tax=Perkinsus olseni TaxID=32597 RepID=A0A7J6QPS5_PEROL|nr:hypothetical protein FOZ63_022582 [Perkinsus olseni]
MTPPTSGSEAQQATEIIPRPGPERLDWLRQSLRKRQTPEQRDYVFSKVTQSEFWEPMEVPQLGVNVILNHIEVFSEEQQALLKDQSRYPMRLLAGGHRHRDASVTGSERSRESRRRKVHRIGSLVSSGGYITVGSSRRVHTGSKEERSRGRAVKRKVREQHRQKKAEEEVSKAARTTEGSVKSSSEIEGISTPEKVDGNNAVASAGGSPVGSPSVEVDYSVDSPVVVCPALPNEQEFMGPPQEAQPGGGDSEVAVASGDDENEKEVISEKKRAVLAKKQELLQKQIDLQRLILRRRRESSPPAQTVQPRPRPALPPRGPPRIVKTRPRTMKKSGGVSPEEALKRVRELKNAGTREKAFSEMSELDKFERCKAEVMAKKQQAKEKPVEAEAVGSPADSSEVELRNGGSPAGSSEVEEEPWFVKVRSLPPSSPKEKEDVTVEEREKKLIGIVLQERYKGSSGNSDIFGDAEDSDREEVLKTPQAVPPQRQTPAGDDELDIDDDEFLRLDYSDN